MHGKLLLISSGYDRSAPSAFVVFEMQSRDAFRLAMEEGIQNLRNLFSILARTSGHIILPSAANSAILFRLAVWFC
jgi:hypothetical protein